MAVALNFVTEQLDPSTVTRGSTTVPKPKPRIRIDAPPSVGCAGEALDTIGGWNAKLNGALRSKARTR